MERMKRLVVSGPGVFEVVDVELPRPGPDELLIAPLRVGVCATDLELIDGTLIYLRTGQLQLPLTPGHEWVGRVTEVGADVAMFAVGDLVVGECSIGCGRCEFCTAGAYHQCPTRRETGIIGLDGALQQRMAFPAGSTHRVPEGIDLADAALIEPTAVAFRAIDRLAPPPGAAVLVVGGGTQGTLAAQLLMNLLKADVALIDSRPDRLERVRRLGVRAPAVGETFRHVLEAAGTSDSLDVARGRMAPGGTLVVVGLSGQPTVGVAVDDLVVKDQSMIGSVGSPGVWPDVIRHVAAGAVQPSALVTQVVDLTDFSAAYSMLRQRDPSVGKVLVAPNGL
jgi:L-iditol 2-dehydrogenase